MNGLSDRQKQVRHDIATATVGFLIALAFGAMVGAVEDSIKSASAVAKQPTLPRDTALLAGIFFLIGLSFFVGAQMYLWDTQVQDDVHRGWWLFDFVSTVVSLTLLTLLGANSNTTFKHQFGVTLTWLVGYQVFWQIVHGVGRKNFRLGWFVSNLLAFTGTLLLLEASGPLPDLVALWVLAVGYFLKLWYDLWVFARSAI